MCYKNVSVEFFSSTSYNFILTTRCFPTPCSQSFRKHEINQTALNFVPNMLQEKEMAPHLNKKLSTMK
jgi:hypothetical protein